MNHHLHSSTTRRWALRSSDLTREAPASGHLDPCVTSFLIDVLPAPRSGGRTSLYLGEDDGEKERGKPLTLISMTIEGKEQQRRQ